jgi:hypothetical protein
MAATKAARHARGEGQPAVSAQAKLQWLQIVALDQNVASAMRVAVLIATRYLNGRSGEAWPSLETLAKNLGVDRKTVTRAVAHLVAREYLAKESGGGRRRSNTYRLLFLRENGAATVPDTGTISSPKQGQNCPPNPRKEPDERTHRASEEADIPFEAFETAWRWEAADPRPPARRLFEELGREDRAEAVRLAPVYLADCEKEGRKRCFARTYLADRRWTGFAATQRSQTATAQLVAIFPDTPPWEAWTKHKGRNLPTTEILCPDGRCRQGWRTPTEWPPGYGPTKAGEG